MSDQWDKAEEPEAEEPEAEDEGGEFAGGGGPARAIYGTDDEADEHGDNLVAPEEPK